jgi:hypothetical protein
MNKALQDEDAITISGPEAGSVLDSLLEEDEPTTYGSISQQRQPWDA